MNVDVYSTNTRKHVLVPAGRPVSGLPEEIQSIVKPPAVKTVTLLAGTPLIGLAEAEAATALDSDGYYVSAVSIEWRETTIGK